MAETIKVLIVDDSLLIRKQVTEILGRDPEIEVVGVAMDGDFALMKLGRLLPDVIILDINMPRMDGLSTLKIISEQYAIPTIILSSYTREGAFTTIQALKYGAVDFVCKPSEGSVTANQAYLEKNLIEKIKMVQQARRRRNYDSRRMVLTPSPSTVSASGISEESPSREIDSFGSGISRLQEEKLQELYSTTPANMQKIVAIGASTGGTTAVEKIIRSLPPDFPAGIVVVQHMPKEFTGVFAETLNYNVSLSVAEARDSQEIEPGKVYISPGDAHLQVRRVNTRYFVQLDRVTGPVNGLCPSVDVLFYSVAMAAGKKAIGVVLTGMGKDGAFGVRALKKTGGHVIAQDEESCVVFGMPKEAIKTGAVDQVTHLSDISSWLMFHVGRESEKRFSFPMQALKAGGNDSTE